MKITQFTLCKNCIYFYAHFTSYFHFFNSFGTLSTNLLVNCFLHLQFLLSSYSPTSHNFSHSRSQLLGFQIYPLLHTPLSINSLHSHRNLPSFQRCLLLQTLTSSLHLHLYVSCHFISS